MSAENNKAAERRFYTEIWAKHNLAVVDELIAPNIVEHNTLLPGQEPGLEGYRHTLVKLFSAFPDLHSSIEDLVAEGDKIAVHWTARGTHKGDFMGVPPTNKPVTSEGIDIIRYEGGKRVEIWRQWDVLGLMQQLGMVPLPRQGGS